MAKRGRKFKKRLNKLTFGLFDTLIDLTLFSLAVIAQGGRNELFETIDKAIHATKMFHVNSLKRVVYRAKSQSYLEKKKDYLKITRLGLQRLKKVLPKYEEKRSWDAKLYLITYDIPEEKKRQREYLREWLQRLGCAILQRSVWLTPYNPKRLIADFVKENGLVGLVLVSELKEGSGIGGKDIQTVAANAYKLNKINDLYAEFIREVDAGKLNGMDLAIRYLSILKKDPQLPFGLLPGWWSGDDAYDLYKQNSLNKSFYLTSDRRVDKKKIR